MMVFGVTTADAAREAAIEWQHWSSERSLSWSDVAAWSEYFTELGERFGLTDEFTENGII